MASSGKMLPLRRIFTNINKLEHLFKQTNHVVNFQCRCAATDITSGRFETKGSTAKKSETISRAMKAYLERAQSHATFMEKEVDEYQIGKRHLAMIIGADPDHFRQDDIDKAIEYLMPSSLFNKKARPMLKHPDVIVPKYQAAQFDVDGRPFHPYFYTGFPNYYSKMHDHGLLYEELKVYGYTMKQKGLRPIKQLDLTGSSWIGKDSLIRSFGEDVSDEMHNHFTQLVGRIAELPWSYRYEKIIFRYRKKMAVHSTIRNIKEPLISESGRPYQIARGGRKTALARVTLWEQGTGEVSINGKDLLSSFRNILDREQIMFPLQFTNYLGLVDFEAVTLRGGHSSQAGALRLALSKALVSFVSKDMVDKMRLAGLLTRDPRMRERKKYGQEGARRKYTWKKR